MDLIRLNVHPGVQKSRRGTSILTQLVIATAQTRIVKSTAASPWEVFLRPDEAQRLSIHYRRPAKPKSKKP